MSEDETVSVGVYALRDGEWLLLYVVVPVRRYSVTMAVGLVVAFLGFFFLFATL